MIGFGGSCSSQTAGPQQLLADTVSKGVYGNNVVGQSFVAAGSGTVSLQRITVAINPLASVTATMRVGTTTDLSSSYLASTTAAVTTDADYDFVFSPTVTLTGGNTYYYMVMNSSSSFNDRFTLDEKTSTPYPDGSAREGTSAWVVGDGLSTDQYFKIWMCD